jgi:predicted HicB family RNase H-like nuclease
MNFIDRALKRISEMSADEFLQSMADIYKEPIDRNEVKKYPQFVQDVIFIIDYDTELQMEGLVGFFNDSTKDYVDETIIALKNCGAIKEAEILEQCKKINICDYDSYMDLENDIYINNDFEGFWKLVVDYIEREKKLQNSNL